MEPQNPNRRKALLAVAGAATVAIISAPDEAHAGTARNYVRSKALENKVKAAGLRLDRNVVKQLNVEIEQLLDRAIARTRGNNCETVRPYDL